MAKIITYSLHFYIKLRIILHNIYNSPYLILIIKFDNHLSKTKTEVLAK